MSLFRNLNFDIPLRPKCAFIIKIPNKLSCLIIYIYSLFVEVFLFQSDNPNELGTVDEYNYPLANERWTTVVPSAFNTYVWNTVPVKLTGNFGVAIKHSREGCVDISR